MTRTVMLVAVLASPVAADSPDFTLSSGVPDDNFGGVVGISNKTIIVGAPGGLTQDAYFFERDSEGVWSQVAQFHAPDDASTFGGSVAVSGGIALVGDYGCPETVSVYVRGESGWSLQGTLTGPEGCQESFGWSVAVAGDTGVVGARADGDDNTGGVYFFDNLSGGGNLTFIVNGLAPAYLLGDSVAISGNTAILGAGGSGTPGGAGAAHVFVNDGGWRAQDILLPADGNQGDKFGEAVAVSGDVTVVGARRHQEDGSVGGAAYVFERDAVWTQTAKLTSPGPVGKFGTSVAVEGHTIIVGESPGPGSSAGVAWVFTRGESGWQHAGQLEPADGFGFNDAIAISDGTLVAGSWTIAGDDLGSVLGYDLELDRDGDGLKDIWEIEGIPYVDTFGVERLYELPFANPDRKNLYVEIDVMSGLNFSLEAELMVEEAFANAPVENPDGTTGIDIHFCVDDDTIPFLETWIVTDWPPLFVSTKALFFGTEPEREDPARDALLKAKRKAYRYCIVVNRLQKLNGKTIAGKGEIGGNDMVIKAYSSAVDEAAVFMHELGHNLGLRHGGCENENWKPNYPSIMNYALGCKLSWNEHFWTLDYSRCELPSLNESSVDETLPIDGCIDHVAYEMPFGYNVNVNGETVRKIGYIDYGGFARDIGDENGTGFLDGILSESVVQDLNYFPGNGVGGTPVSSPGDTLRGHDDWANIRLAISAGAASDTGASEYPEEITLEQVEWIDKNFPLPPGACPADLDGNGAVDVQDLVQLILDWDTDGSKSGSDLDGNGVVDVVDLVELITSWGPCS